MYRNNTNHIVYTYIRRKHTNKSKSLAAQKTLMKRNEQLLTKKITII